MHAPMHSHLNSYFPRETGLTVAPLICLLLNIYRLCILSGQAKNSSYPSWMTPLCFVPSTFIIIQHFTKSTSSLHSTHTNYFKLPFLITKPTGSSQQSAFKKNSINSLLLCTINKTDLLSHHSVFFSLPLLQAFI